MAQEVLNWLKESNQTSTGVTQAEYTDRYLACLALGAISYTKANSVFLEMAEDGGGIDNLAAGMIYLKLTQNEKSDIAEFFVFLNKYKELRAKGVFTTLAKSAFAVLCNDKIVPQIPDQKKLVDIAWSYIDDEEMDTCVPLIASFCAGFESELVKGLLYKIVEKGIVERSYIRSYAEDALQGKYHKYNPLA